MGIACCIFKFFFFLLNGGRLLLTSNYFNCCFAMVHEINLTFWLSNLIIVDFYIFDTRGPLFKLVTNSVVLWLPII